ncbi:MAG TPA: hypothetical protein VKP64_03530 [Mycobacteriales bacterium]|nr:hypothetical protein [Mycobacteriales bacterium]
MEKDYGTLYDADTAEPLGPATPEQRAAGDAAGGAGTFRIDGAGNVILDEAAAARAPQPVRRVYVLGEEERH